MVMSFALWVKHYPMVHFTRPVLRSGTNTFKVEGLRTLWTHERKFKLSEDISMEVGGGKQLVVMQKNPNSFNQNNLLYSIGYLSILTQIGCYVPAKALEIEVFSTLLSKINVP